MMRIIATLIGMTNGYKILAFGDWGRESHSDKLDDINRYIMISSDYDSVFLLGDNFYPNGIDPKFGINDSKFLLFSDHLAKDIEGINFNGIMGNHDYKLGDLTSQFVYPHPRWIMPNKYYFQRFNSGMICVWFIDTTFFFDDSDQIPWLINSLENESEECHWKLMAGHRPVYSAGEYATTDGTLAYQPVITDIISKYGIHMYFSGHEHNSQVLFKDGVYYLIAGAICELRSGSLTTDNEYYSNNLYDYSGKQDDG